MDLPDPFRWRDFGRKGRTYRCFGYAHASDPEMWNRVSLEARGITFDITDEPKLVAWPMPKFFNVGENHLAPTWSDLRGALITPSHRTAHVMEKLDGTLLMTVPDGDGDFFFKTKMGTEHPSCQLAYRSLTDHQRYELIGWANRGYTVCLEWTSPTNRIVVPYKGATLTVICARWMRDGTMHWADERVFTTLPCVQRAPIPDVVNDEGIEGVVISLWGNTIVKVKTDWYKRLHRIEAGSLRAALFAAMDAQCDGTEPDKDAYRLAEVYAWSGIQLAHARSVADNWVDRFANASRKELAIAAKVQLEPHLFALTMAIAAGKDWRDWWRSPATRRTMLERARKRFDSSDDEVSE